VGHKAAVKQITQKFHLINNFIEYTSKILGVRGCFLGVKLFGLTLARLSSSAEVKNEWSCASAPLVFLHFVDRDKFAFLHIENKNIIKSSAWFGT